MESSVHGEGDVVSSRDARRPSSTGAATAPISVSSVCVADERRPEGRLPSPVPPGGGDEQEELATTLASTSDAFNFLKTLFPPSSHLMRLDDGRCVPLTRMPVAKAYPKQMYWIPVERSFYTVDCAMLQFIPLIPQVEVDDEFIGQAYDPTYITPLDSPELAANETSMLSDLESARVPRELVGRIVQGMNRLRDGRRDEYSLYRKALQESAADTLSLQQLVLLQSIARRTAIYGDSPRRILLLFLTSASTSINRHPCDSLKCTCPERHPRTFATLFWSRGEYDVLEAALSAHGFDYCKLSRLLPGKSCNMVHHSCDHSVTLQIDQVSPG